MTLVRQMGIQCRNRVVVFTETSATRIGRITGAPNSPILRRQNENLDLRKSEAEKSWI